MGGKRPRTPHFITGIGDGDTRNRVPSDDLFDLGGKNDRNKLPNTYIRSRNERLIRMEEPGADHWKDVFGSADAANVPTSVTSGPWQVSAFAILGCIVVMSAIFLHLVSESSNDNTSPYHYRRRQRQRRAYKTRKKKTDEWSDDEEEAILQASVAAAEAQGQGQDQPLYPLYYQQPNARFQENRHRRSSKDPVTPPPLGKNSGNRASNNYYLPTPNYHKSPSLSKAATTTTTSPGNSSRRRQIGASSSFNSNYSASLPSPGEGFMVGPPSGRLRLPTPPDGTDLFHPVPTASASSSGSRQLRLPTAPEESQLLVQPALLSGGGGGSGLNARPLQMSNFSSFASLDLGKSTTSSGSDKSMNFSNLVTESPYDSTRQMQGSLSSSMQESSSRHHASLVLSPGHCEETPRVVNQRRIFDLEPIEGVLQHDQQFQQGCGRGGEDPTGLSSGLSPPEGTSAIPFIPTLGTPEHGQRAPHLAAAYSPPPRSILMDELKLIQMETGNSMHWQVQQAIPSQQQPQSPSQSNSHNSFEDDADYDDDDSANSYSDVSIPSGDPRKALVHKRHDITIATDAAGALQSSINFEELRLQEVIGGGGFGQVWRATWRGTPVAVKILTGSAQNKHVAKAILQEFKAEINLLKGMRHPNICLYMGACVKPPNRAIITELAANGSVWDALRLPLMPPYVPADGTPRGSWPLKLYVPDQHGSPPGSSGMPRVAPPIPPKGAWPWELVKRVACGAARGMAYLHSGNPPVLHRDLKSANLLLDDSYTAKVCDFGLSRLKAQERSMTGNCGTVQWMAPEVLANMSYNEKADVYSYGIIVWELLSRECPYEGMTAIQCALAVLNRDKRPEIPKWCPPSLHALIKACVKKEPDQRPTFEQILLALDAME